MIERVLLHSMNTCLAVVAHLLLVPVVVLDGDAGVRPVIGQQHTLHLQHGKFTVWKTYKLRQNRQCLRRVPSMVGTAGATWCCCLAKRSPHPGCWHVQRWMTLQQPTFTNMTSKGVRLMPS